MNQKKKHILVFARIPSNCSITLNKPESLTGRAVTLADKERDSGRNFCVYMLADALRSNTVKLRPVTLHEADLSSANTHHAITARCSLSRWKKMKVFLCCIDGATGSAGS